MIACDCAVCTSADPHDRRTRASALFSFEGRHLLVDTSPELRLQCLACGVRQVDAILYTHAHADHVAGLDDVRRFNWLQGRALDVYGAPATLKRIHTMFRYAFENEPEYPSAKPDLNLAPISGVRAVWPAGGSHSVSTGQQTVLGFRIGDIAYCPD